MKLTITVQGATPNERMSMAYGNTFALDTEPNELQPAEVERLVQLWLLAATESVSLTQQVIDQLADRVKQNTAGLKNAIDIIVGGTKHGQ